MVAKNSVLAVIGTTEGSRGRSHMCKKSLRRQNQTFAHTNSTFIKKKKKRQFAGKREFCFLSAEAQGTWPMSGSSPIKGLNKGMIILGELSTGRAVQRVHIDTAAS